MMKIAFLILVLVVIHADCTLPPSERTMVRRLNPCDSAKMDSTILCGTLSVFENTQFKSGRKIDISIIVIHAIDSNAKKAPIFWFDGGPGIASSNGLSWFADSIVPYRKNHDIVLMDVRGTGQSNPLHCHQLQNKEDLNAHFSEMYPPEAVKRCYDSLSVLADLSQYTTTNMALDLEAVRLWLGYDKINLFGLSYGTRLAQVYIKMFPNAVESCVLWSPTTTYSKMPLYHAKYAQASLQKLFDDCSMDSLCQNSFPQLKKEFTELMLKWEQRPFDHELQATNGQHQMIKIPWYAFQTKMRSMMYSPSGMRQIPFIVHQAYLGNLEPFIALFPNESYYDDFLAEGLYLCVTCSEDIPFIHDDDILPLTRGTFMGDYRIVQQRRACTNWSKGYVPNDFFEPLVSNIPVLIFSGYFDPVTPPSVAEQISKTLPNSYLVSIATGSHMFDGLSNYECLDDIASDFFYNQHVRPNSECIRQMLPDKYKTK